MTLVETLSKADDKIDRLERRVTALHTMMLVSVAFLLNGQGWSGFEVLILVGGVHVGVAWLEGRAATIPGVVAMAEALSWLRSL